MKRFLAFFLALTVLCGLCSCGEKQPGTTTTEKVQKIVDAARALVAVQYPAKQSSTAPSEAFLSSVNDFSYQTAFSEFGKEVKNSNFSPLSLYYALALTAAGAKGDTQKELLALLGEGNIKTLSDGSAQLFRYLYKDTSSAKLKLANSLWMNKSVSFKTDYLKTAAEKFYASGYSVDFSDPLTGKAIGKWISDHTGGTLSPDFQTQSQNLLIVLNTVWLKSHWQTAFKKSQNTDGVFHGQAGDTKVTFMNTSDEGTFAKGKHFTRASLSLSDGAEMVFVLPDKGTSLLSLISSERDLKTAFTGGSEKAGQITWSVPKFTINSNYDLNNTLKKLGVKKAFDPDTADFSALTDSKAFISSVIQQTHIAVDENGVEASAFTAVTLEGSTISQEKADMTLDRPFLYALEQNGVILFVGICAKV